MKYMMFAIIPLLLASGAASAEDKVLPVPPALQQMRSDAMTACPHKGAEAVINIDKSLSRGLIAQRVTLLCLAEVVKDLQARVKELKSDNDNLRAEFKRQFPTSARGDRGAQDRDPEKGVTR